MQAGRGGQANYLHRRAVPTIRSPGFLGREDASSLRNGKVGRRRVRTAYTVVTARLELVENARCE